MWTRKDLKLQAKESLRVNYWKGFLVALILSFLSGGVSSVLSSFSQIVSIFVGNNSGSSNVFSDWDFDPQSFNNITDKFSDISADGMGFIGVLVVILVVIIVISMIFSIVYTFLVLNPFQVGSMKYFIAARTESGDLSNMIFPFKKGRYAASVKAMAWKFLFENLWTLLFIIPGIVKGYAYAMVPYLMADNPELDYKSALKLSMHMTDGQKGRMFVLDLSFIGWGLLAILTLGIGFLFLAPYIYATKAELYIALKKIAIEEGIIVPIELQQELAPVSEQS